jgi:hypothetical protein
MSVIRPNNCHLPREKGRELCASMGPGEEILQQNVALDPARGSFCGPIHVLSLPG